MSGWCAFGGLSCSFGLLFTFTPICIKLLLVSTCTLLFSILLCVLLECCKCSPTPLPIREHASNSRWGKRGVFYILCSFVFTSLAVVIIVCGLLPVFCDLLYDRYVFIYQYICYYFLLYLMNLCLNYILAFEASPLICAMCIVISISILWLIASVLIYCV